MFCVRDLGSFVCDCMFVCCVIVYAFGFVCCNEVFQITCVSGLRVCIGFVFLFLCSFVRVCCLSG